MLSAVRANKSQPTFKGQYKKGGQVLKTHSLPVAFQFPADLSRLIPDSESPVLPEHQTETSASVVVPSNVGFSAARPLKPADWVFEAAEFPGTHHTIQIAEKPWGAQADRTGRYGPVSLSGNHPERRLGVSGNGRLAAFGPTHRGDVRQTIRFVTFPHTSPNAEMVTPTLIQSMQP